VSYSQSVERNAAVYPLTLRYPWFIPAEWIQIKVLMPMGFSQAETSLPCSLSTDESGSLLYTWSSSNGALPDHDMVVLWQPRAETTDRNKER